MSRAAVVACSLRTPLGSSAAEVALALLAGARAVRPNPRIAPSYACSLAATVDAPLPRSKHSRFVGRMGLYGMTAAEEAMRAAQGQGGERAALFSAVGGLRARWDDLMPVLERQSPDGEGVWAKGFKDMHPFWMLQHLSNNAHALASIALRILGEGATFGGASAGAEAIASASRALATGACDAALVMAYDSLLEPETLVELGERGEATAARSLDELGAPYAADARGGVPGEAAAALWLVREGDIESPIAIVEARAIADGSRVAPAASTIARVAAPLVRGVEVIDGAARAEPGYDREEREALARLGLSGATPILATRASLGMMGAAAPIVQTIVLAELLRLGELPAIAGLASPAEGPLRPLAAREITKARVALGLTAAAPGLATAVRVEAQPALRR